jgi:hypothetical protein
MLTLVLIIKLIAEIALLVLLAQGLVGLMAGPSREANHVFRFLKFLGQPWVKVARLASPRVVLDRHVPLVAFFGMALVWVVAAVLKVGICLHIGLALCR